MGFVSILLETGPINFRELHMPCRERGQLEYSSADIQGPNLFSEPPRTDLVNQSSWSPKLWSNRYVHVSSSNEATSVPSLQNRYVHIIGDQYLSINGSEVFWPPDHPKPLHEKALTQERILGWEQRSSMIGKVEKWIRDNHSLFKLWDEWRSVWIDVLPGSAYIPIEWSCKTNYDIPSFLRSWKRWWMGPRR